MTKDNNIIACCWLYCSKCIAYKKWKCAGCHKNIKAERWCAVKNCCKEKSIANCSECSEYSDYKKCKKLNNFISKVFWLIFKSDRCACINYIKDKWIDSYIDHMEEIDSYNNPNK